MTKILAVALGGALGALCRYWTNSLFLDKLELYDSISYGTLVVNVVGCFLIGVFMVIFTEHLPKHAPVSEYGRLLLVTGFLGALTTFSAYSYETFKLLETGDLTSAFSNIAANLVFGLLATYLGITLARSLS